MSKSTSSKTTPLIINAGPVVFQFKDSGGAERYHVKGKGAVAPSIRDATRYEVDPYGRPLTLTPFPTSGGIPICLALIEVIELTQNYARVRWGEEEAIIPPGNLHLGTYGAIRNRLYPFVQIGGGPYGSNLRLKNPHREQDTVGLFDVGFILPGDTGEIVNFANPRGTKPFPILPANPDPLGLRLNPQPSKSENSSEWFRLFNGCSLHLESGFRNKPKSIWLASADAETVSYKLPQTSFATIHPRLVEFIPRASESDRATARKLFISLFSDL